MTIATINSKHASGDKHVETARNEIKILSEDLTDLYQATKHERQLVHHRTWKKRGYFLDEIEDFTNVVQGYASWVIKRGTHPKAALAMEELRQLNAHPLLSATQNYPQLRLYVAFHDYLRRLLMEYLGAAR